MRELPKGYLTPCRYRAWAFVAKVDAADGAADAKETGMAQYLLLIYGDESAWSQATEDDRAATLQAYGDYSKWLADKGWMLGGDALHDTSQATSVKLRNDERLVTDGPFAETKEQLGGYYLVEVENLDDAIEAAARCPGAAYGTMEVRPILPMGGA